MIFEIIIESSVKVMLIYLYGTLRNWLIDKNKQDKYHKFVINHSAVQISTLKNLNDFKMDSVKSMLIQFYINEYYQNLDITGSNYRVSKFNLRDPLNKLNRININSNFDYSYINSEHFQLPADSTTEFMYKFTKCINKRKFESISNKILSFKEIPCLSVNLPNRCYNKIHKDKKDYSAITSYSICSNKSFKWYPTSMVLLKDIEQYSDFHVKFKNLESLKCIFDFIKYKISVIKNDNSLSLAPALLNTGKLYGKLTNDNAKTIQDELEILSNCIDNLCSDISNTFNQNVNDSYYYSMSFDAFKYCFEYVPYFIQSIHNIALTAVFDKIRTNPKPESIQTSKNSIKFKILILQLKTNLIFLENILNNWLLDPDQFNEIFNEIKETFQNICPILYDIRCLLNQKRLSVIFDNYSKDMNLLQSRILTPLLSIITIRNMLYHINKFVNIFGEQNVIQLSCKKSLFRIYNEYKINLKPTNTTNIIYLSCIDFDGSFRKSFMNSIIDRRLKIFEQKTNTKIELITLHTQKNKKIQLKNKTASLPENSSLCLKPRLEVSCSKTEHKKIVIRIQFECEKLSEIKLNTIIAKLPLELQLSTPDFRQIDITSLSPCCSICIVQSRNSDNMITKLNSRINQQDEKLANQINHAELPKNSNSSCSIYFELK